MVVFCKSSFLKIWLLATLLLFLPSASPALSRGTKAGVTPHGCRGLKGRQVFNGIAVVTRAETIKIPGHFEYCIARASFADSDLKAEMTLPIDHWNHKLLYVGGGGFDGSIQSLRSFQSNDSSVTTYGSFAQSMFSERYAIMVSNGGHDGSMFSALFAYDPSKLVDFMFQSVHRALPIGRQIARMFYGSLPKRTYFEGGSTGGHEALIEAQRYPADFDGIIALAPPANFVGLYTQFHRIARAVTTPEGALNSNKRSLLAKAVLARCDEQDGLKDGILSRPMACDFDPLSLRCSNGLESGDTCLSDAQIATVKVITTPYASMDGSISHPGYDYGAVSSDSDDYIWPRQALEGRSVQGVFADSFIRDFVTQDPLYDTSQWDPNQWLKAIHLINKLFQADDPDLGPFLTRGGKLILWNGEVDQSVSYRDTARYYERVVQTMGQARADQVVELYLAPGVGHERADLGPNRVDLLKALSIWVEGKVPPSQQNLKYEKLDGNGTVIMARPACKYPAYPRYVGHGSVKSPGSFSCTK